MSRRLPIKGVFTFWQRSSKYDPLIRYPQYNTAMRKQAGFFLFRPGAAAGASGFSYPALVFTDPDNGNDAWDGYTFSRPKATITSAVPNLVAATGDDAGTYNGTVLCSQGEHTLDASVIYRQGFSVIGAGPVQSGQSGGTRIKAAAGLDDHMFAALSGISDTWNHFVLFDGFTLDGNYSNQTDGGDFNWSGSATETVTFSASGKTMTLNSGTWDTASLTDGAIIEVTNSTANNGIYTVSGTPSTTVITVAESLADESTRKFVQINSAPYDGIQLQNPGFQCMLDRIAFANIAGRAWSTRKTATNVQATNLTGGSCQGGFYYGFIENSSNLKNALITGTQIDNCGPRPIHIESAGSGASNMLTIMGFEFEAIGGAPAQTHLSCISFNRPSGSNPPIATVIGVNGHAANTTGKLGVIEMMDGNAVELEYIGVGKSGYTNTVYQNTGAAASTQSRGFFGASRAGSRGVGHLKHSYSDSTQAKHGATAASGEVNQSDRENGGLYVGTASKFYLAQTGATQNTITASTTQSQGQMALTKGYFTYRVTTVGNANDVVTLPQPELGVEIKVINKGANTLQIYPASGDDLGAGLNTSVTLAAGATARFSGVDQDNWDQIA